ncbi:MAG: PaaI family thioesterase [Bacteroidales bacterium]|nr:PaaI family thioesterase [Bacteroidales bacterium]
MKKIKNPYLNLENYNCFGCSPYNEIGLKLSFTLDDDTVISTWQPTKQYEGWQNIVHGGIQATLMDEIASWVVFSVLKTAGFTIKMNISLHKNVLVTDGIITLKAKLKSKKLHIATISVSLFNGKGELCSEGEFTYYTYPRNVAVERFYFPMNDYELFEES